MQNQKPEEGRKNKSKEQIIAEMKVRKERKFARDVFFPILCQAITNIHDADIFLQSFSTMLMEKFLSLMKEKKFSDLDLASKLDIQSPQYTSIKQLIGIFNDMTVNEAQEHIDGMKDEIRLFYKEEMKKRPLSSLETLWLE